MDDLNMRKARLFSRICTIFMCSATSHGSMSIDLVYASETY